MLLVVFQLLQHPVLLNDMLAVWLFFLIHIRWSAMEGKNNISSLFPYLEKKKN